MGSLKTVLKEKCPRCGEGELYESRKYFTFSKDSYKMKKNCPCCGLRYEKEVGFFYGAMFISYALNIAIFLTSLAIYTLFLKSLWGWTYFAVGYLSIAVLSTAAVFRFSRSIWLSILTKSEPDILNKEGLVLAE